ncbi:MAG: hypothetical protein DRI86_15245 [Bacteroidetes bacterium]|nr:MAG: hypothetical protein DRI86_15245 [Bacteroidota bacterium]
MRYNVRYSVLILLFIFFTASLFSQNVTVKNGYLDLTNVNLDNKTVELKGNWDFYWHEFLLPTSYLDSLKGHKKYLAKVPKTWRKVRLNEEEYCTSDGFATYRLRLRVDNKNEIYGIKLGSIFTSYRLFVNGKLLNTLGVVGKTKETSEPKFLTQEIPIHIERKDSISSQVIDIILQVSNFYHRRAGIKEPVFFGKMETIIDDKETEISLEVLLLGVILVIGFNHILMYFFNRVDFSNLLFGGLSIIMMLRILSTQERMLLYWFPNMDWELLVRLDNFSGFGTMSFFAIYFYYSFKKDFPNILLYIYMIIGMIITILVFATPAWFYGQFRILLEAYVGIGGLYLTFGVLMVAAIRKRERAFLTFIAMFGLFGTAVYDVLNSMGVINSIDIAPYGIAWFMTIQSYLLTRESAKDRKENKRLGEELKKEKLNLENNIQERISEIQSQSVELKKYKVKQEQLNWINEGLNEIVELMRDSDKDMSKLADTLLPVIIKKIGASVGVMYVYSNDREGEVLKLIARYGIDSESVVEKIEIGEGMVGQCFKDGKERFIEDVPKNYLPIKSGLGEANAKTLAVIPMKIDQLIIGVIEIASLTEINEFHKEFLFRSLENIAAQLNIFRMNDESLSKMMHYKAREEKAMTENRELVETISAIRHEFDELKNRAS